MKKLVMLLALAVAFSLSGFAQTSGSSASSGTPSQDTGMAKDSGMAKKGSKKASAGKSSTITGCLKSDGNPITIANGQHKNGVEVDTSGASGEDWAKHNGHKVQLTGMWEGTGADKKFKATAMKHVAPTCTVPAGKSSAGKKAKAAKSSS
jgi:hypothetical protein